MTAEELLLELKDIQAPPEPGWWVVAPAYWIVFFSVMVIFFIIWLIYRRRKANRLMGLANADLQRIRSLYSGNENTRQLALELSRWLKQVSLLAFPQQRLASLTGEPWLKFLDQTLGSNNFTRGNGQVFGSAIYREQINLDAGHLLQLCEQWLNAVKPYLLQRGRD